jgi:hypothetical protein
MLMGNTISAPSRPDGQIEQSDYRGLTCALRFGRYVGRMRDRETIDSELRLLAAVRWSIRGHRGEPSSRQVDELLDERNQLIGS